MKLNYLFFFLKNCRIVADPEGRLPGPVEISNKKDNRKDFMFLDPMRIYHRLYLFYCRLH